MSVAEGHAHPCIDITNSVSQYGALGPILLTAILANIGDHAPDDGTRAAIRTAFESAAAQIPAAIAAATGGEQS